MIRIFNHYVSKTGFLLLLLESLILLISAAGISAILSVGARSPDSYASTLAFVLVSVFSMSALGMYRPASREDMGASIVRIMPSFVLGFALLNAIIYLVPVLHFSHRRMLLVFALGAAGVLLARLAVLTSARSAMLSARLILVGGGVVAKECMALAGSKLGFHQFTVVGCIDVPGEVRCVPASAMLPGGRSLLSMAQQYAAQEIVVSVTDRRNGAFPLRQLLECALGGVRVIDAATFFERQACQIRVDSLQPS